MSQKVTAGMADNLEIVTGWTLQLNAVDPSSGANIAGVNVSGVVVMAEPVGDDAGQGIVPGPFMLVPGPAA